MTAKTPHQLRAEQVLGAVLNGSANAVLFQEGVETEDYPAAGVYRALHVACLDVLTNGKPVTVENVFAHLNGVFSLESLTAFQVAAPWDKVD